MAKNKNSEKREHIYTLILVSLIICGILAGVVLKIAVGKKIHIAAVKAEKLYAEGNFEAALRTFEKISRNYPRLNKTPINYTHALCLNKLGHTVEAKILLDKIVEGKTDDKYYPASLYELTRIQEAAGEYETAIVSYNRILSDFEGSDIIPEVLVGLGDSLQALKKWGEAKEKYREVILNPESKSFTTAKEKLGALNIKLAFSPVITEYSIAYEVRKGDTLEKIARKFNTTVVLISEANKLEHTMLACGKRLKITPGNFEIHVNADLNRLTLKSNGAFFKEYPAGTGKFGSTPIGTFKIVTKQSKPVWYAEDGIYPYGHKKNILGTHWMGLDKVGYGIHGTTEPETVGTRSSRGCIRLYNRDVEELYKLVTVGTPVIITGTISENALE